MGKIIHLSLYLFSCLSSGFSQSVTLYEDIHFRGESKHISLTGGGCKNVLDWNDKASSIQMDGAECVELFEHINCGGRSIKLRKDSRHLENFGLLNFNDELTSIKMCDNSNSGGDGGSDLCVAEHNAVRAQHGLHPLIPNDAIARASQIHIERVKKDNCHEVGNPHQCPGEKPFGDRFRDEGCKWSGAAENIMLGSGDCKSAVEGWMGSEGHRAAILHDYKHIGCGRKDNFWCCGFANPA